MPYRIIKFDQGYKVINMKTGHLFSNDYLPLKVAKAQLKAIQHIRHHRGGNEYFLYGGSLGDIVKRVVHVFKNTYSPNIEKYDKLYGDYIVEGGIIRRTPVEKAIKALLNVISLGKFSNYKTTYDELYHLALIVLLKSPTTGERIALQMEKRPNIEIKKVYTAFDSKTDMAIFPEHPITLNNIFTYAKAIDGVNLYNYDASKYNCQQFVSTLVHAFGDNVGKEADKFILQDITEQFLSGHTKYIGKKITDLGHFFGRLTGSAE